MNRIRPGDTVWLIGHPPKHRWACHVLATWRDSLVLIRIKDAMRIVATRSECRQMRAGGNGDETT